MHCYPPTVGSAWRSQGTTNSRSSTVAFPQLILARSKLHSGVVFAKRDCPHTALAAVIESRCFRRPQFWRARPGRPLSFRPGSPPRGCCGPRPALFYRPDKTRAPPRALVGYSSLFIDPTKPFISLRRDTRELLSFDSSCDWTHKVAALATLCVPSQKIPLHSLPTRRWL